MDDRNKHSHTVPILFYFILLFPFFSFLSITITKCKRPSYSILSYLVQSDAMNATQCKKSPIHDTRKKRDPETKKQIK